MSCTGIYIGRTCTVCEKKICNNYQICVYCHGKFHTKCFLISENEVRASLNHQSVYCRNCACTLFPFAMVANNNLFECFGEAPTLHSSSKNSLCKEFITMTFQALKFMCGQFMQGAASLCLEAVLPRTLSLHQP